MNEIFDKNMIDEMLSLSQRAVTIFSEIKKKKQEREASKHSLGGDRDVDWEIVKMYNDYDKVHAYGVNCKEYKCSIHSVLRKSDGEIFTLGDKIDMDECGEKPIDAFLIGGKGKECGHSETDLWLSTNKKKGYGTLLQYAIKIQSTQRTSERPPLGLLPIKFWKVARLNEIENAIIRFVNARREIPPEWIKERDALLEWVKSDDSNNEWGTI